MGVPGRVAAVFATMQARRKSWVKTLLPILFLMAFVPVLNSAFQMFNSGYYARWFYMLTLMMSLATVTALENPRADWKRAIKWTLGFTLGIALPIGLMVQTGANGDGETVSIGLEAYPSRFWAYVAIALLSLLLLSFLMKDYPPAPAGAFQAEGTVLLPAAVQRGADKALCAVLHVRRGGHHGGVFPVFYHARQDAEQRQPHPYDPLFAQRRERPGD